MSQQNSCERIYFATQQFAFSPDCKREFTEARGVQSLSINTDVPLEEVFQLGKLSVRQQLEDLPNIELTLDKTVDTSPGLFVLGSREANAPTLVSRANQSVIGALSIFDVESECASGTPLDIIEMSGLYATNVSFNFSVDGFFTESVSYAGNDILVKDDDLVINPCDTARMNSMVGDGLFTGTQDSCSGITDTIAMKEHLTFAYTNGQLDACGFVTDPDTTILPAEVQGITPSGTNEVISGKISACIQNISISADLTRTDRKCLGSRQIDCKILELPVEITTDIEVEAKRTGLRSLTANGVLANCNTDTCPSNAFNLRDNVIRIATCNGTRIYLGQKNKLTSISRSGGDTGGGNVTVTYSYRTFNDFTVLHENDPNLSGATWWANREDYLTTT